MGFRERINASLTDIRDRGQRLVQLNLELLTAELKAKGRQFGAAAGMFVGAALLALYAIGFTLATIAAVLDIWLPLWLSLLIVALALFLIILILVLVGRSKLRKAKTIAPERAVAEAKTTVDTMRTGVLDTAARVRPKKEPEPAGPASAGTSAPADAKPPASAATPAGPLAPPAAAPKPQADAPPAPTDEAKS